MTYNLLLVLVMTMATIGVAKERPNIIFVLTDNQDVTLGGMEPMRHTQRLLVEQGVTFSKAYAATPVCCPSRASILTGKYPHNHGTVTNLKSGRCYGSEWQNVDERQAYAPALRAAGYDTLHVGKYLNRYGLEEEGGVGRVPPGWTHWRSLVGNSVYYNYTLSIDGQPEYHGSKAEDYFTTVVKSKAIDFLEKERNFSRPFFMCLSTSAPHFPQTPEAKYADEFANLKAPRTPAFNVDPKSTKHWLTRMEPRTMSNTTMDHVDEVFRNRWRALLSVDDMVKEVVEILQKQDILDKTYIVFASDHGFHLGQFGLPFDMRNLYEFDIRMPLVIRGPDLPTNVTLDTPVLNIDLAPTFLDMAGILGQARDDVSPDAFDGQSFLHGLAKARRFLIEYQGEGRPVHQAKVDPECSKWDTGEFYICYSDFGCRCVDTLNNTYTCLRTIDSDDDDSIFCRFEDNEAFHEYYDLEMDPFQLDNQANRLPQQRIDFLTQELEWLRRCKGQTCQDAHHGFMRLRLLEYWRLVLTITLVLFVIMLYHLFRHLAMPQEPRDTPLLIDSQ